jgi:hypothetical protein
MTETPFLGRLPGVVLSSDKQKSSEQLWSQLRDSSIPAQKAEFVARAVCYLVDMGSRATGMGLYIQGGEVFDIEAELDRARPSWLSERMGYLLQRDKAA